MGHATKLTANALPFKSARASATQRRCTRRNADAHAPAVALPLPCRPIFWGEATRNLTPKALRVAPLTRARPLTSTRGDVGGVTATPGFDPPANISNDPCHGTRRSVGSPRLRPVRWRWFIRRRFLGSIPTISSDQATTCGNTWLAAGGIIPTLPPGRTAPPREGGPHSGRQGRPRLGVPRGRSCRLSPLPLSSASASVASDPEKGDGMSLRKRGGIWWIDVVAPNGERIRRTTGTANKALAQEVSRSIQVRAVAHRQVWATSRGALGTRRWCDG